MLNDENSSHLLYFNCALRWFALRMDILMNIVTFIVALLVILSFSSISASSKGLSLSYIIQVTCSVRLSLAWRLWNRVLLERRDVRKDPTQMGSMNKGNLLAHIIKRHGSCVGFRNSWIIAPGFVLILWRLPSWLYNGDWYSLRAATGRKKEESFSYPSHWEKPWALLLLD